MCSATSLTSDVKNGVSPFVCCGERWEETLEAHASAHEHSVEAAVAEQWTEEIVTASGMARDGEGYEQIASTAADVRVDERGP